MINVLFLCTHNSARSIIAEILLNTLGRGKFTGFSAGSSPKTEINPIAKEIAAEMRYDNKKLYSKSWDEFSKPNSPKMHVIITVCDSAANEACPVWLGHPATAHWGFSDPSKVEGSYIDKKRAFVSVMNGLRNRLDIFSSLPLEKLDHLSVQAELRKLASV